MKQKPSKTKQKKAIIKQKPSKTLRVQGMKLPKLLAHLADGIPITDALDLAKVPSRTHYNRMRTNPAYAKLIRTARGKTLKKVEYLMDLVVTQELKKYKQAILVGKKYRIKVTFRELLEYASRRNPAKYANRQIVASDDLTKALASKTKEQLEDIKRAAKS